MALRTRSKTRSEPGPGRFVDVDVPGFSGRVRLREDGPPSADVLVLLHGFSGSLHWFDRVVPLLDDVYHLVRVDLLGHGATGGPPADAPLQAAVVDAVLAELDVENVAALGHSFGADVAVELAERSSRVARLIIVTQAPDYSDANLPRAGVLMTRPVLAVALHRSGAALASALHAGGITRRWDADRRTLAARALSDFRALRTAMFRTVLVTRRDRMAARPLDAQVRDAGKPTLVILGGRDHFYGARSADRYRAAGARVEIQPESGHSPLVEMPEPTAAIIRDFLDTTG